MMVSLNFITFIRELDLSCYNLEYLDYEFNINFYLSIKWDWDMDHSLFGNS